MVGEIQDMAGQAWQRVDAWVLHLELLLPHLGAVVDNPTIDLKGEMKSTDSHAVITNSTGMSNFTGVLVFNNKLNHLFLTQ